MTRGERAILLNAGSLAGVALLLLGAIIWFPATWRELSRIRAIQTQLSDTLSIEVEARTFSNQIKTRVQAVQDRLTTLEQQLDNASFTLLPATKISHTIETLADQFAETGVNIVNMSYKSRIAEEGFITLPFEIFVESSYLGIRKLLHLIETHPAHLFLDRLEFVSLDNDRHLLQARLACLIRFQQNP